MGVDSHLICARLRDIDRPAKVAHGTVINEGHLAKRLTVFPDQALISYLFESHVPPKHEGHPHIMTMCAFISTPVFPFLSTTREPSAGAVTSTAAGSSSTRHRRSECFSRDDPLGDADAVCSLRHRERTGGLDFDLRRNGYVDGGGKFRRVGVESRDSPFRVHDTVEIARAARGDFFRKHFPRRGVDYRDLCAFHACPEELGVFRLDTDGYFRWNGGSPAGDDHAHQECRKKHHESHV
ncbi:MAG: hypothetical protein MZV64_71095 [Ignavibacteriales bacterium]|nr:hypothetical protein [Ignavibacteriales bacterium]